jgi:hypothetical protein
MSPNNYESWSREQLEMALDHIRSVAKIHYEDSQNLRAKVNFLKVVNRHMFDKYEAQFSMPLSRYVYKWWQWNKRDGKLRRLHGSY